MPSRRHEADAVHQGSARSRVRCLGVAATCAFASALPWSASAQSGVDASSAADLILAMSDALRELNYEGTFVHIVGDNMTSLKVLHSFDGNGELERMVALDGEAREVFRTHSLVTCIWPDTQSVITSTSKPRSRLPQIDTSLTDHAHYAISLGDLDRVAGVEARIVEVDPTDSLRYGYRFWIDTDNGMMLRSMLLDEDQRPIEQVMFTSISYPESIARSRFDVKEAAVGAPWLAPKLNELESDASLSPACPASAPDDGATVVDHVAFSSLPAGYREVSETEKDLPSRAGMVSHSMVSDGMASVSVYVERNLPEDYQGGLAGHSRMGSVNAYSLPLENAIVTVVGEVPAETVKLIAKATTLRAE